MEYTIVYDSEIIDFENKVSELLQKGWELQGGVSISISESDEFKYPYFAQALIRRRVPKEEKHE